MVYNRPQKQMKKILFLAFSLSLAAMAMAQNSGLGFNYQAVVRDADGVLLANSNVTLRVSLYPGQMAATPSWVETHSVNTDMSGCFGITVGHGTRDNASTAANYSDINFAAVYYWMKIEIQEGGSFREVSYAQLPSSPYSEVAHNAIAIPAGSIIPFAGPVENIPAGWMLCDGSAVSRSTYANLYNAIGVAWGNGDGSSTFNLPDLRGMFLRGVAGTDTIGDPDASLRLANAHGGNPGNNVGSYQGDAIRNITGSCGDFGGNSFRPTVGDGALWKVNGDDKCRGQDETGTGILSVNFDASRVVPVGSDNRPKNVAVTYIIKY